MRRRTVLLWAAGILVAVWSLLPVYYAFVVSFAAEGAIPTQLGLPSEWTWFNWRDVFFGGGMGILSGQESDPIWPYMQNSLVVAACVSVLTVGIVLPAAYTFSRYRSRSSRVVMISLLFFRMIPIIALAIPVYFLMRTLGLLGSWQSLVFAQLIYTVPLAAWLMKGYFDMLPIEIEESALIDGASRLTILRRIVIPLSRPGLAVAVMFSFLISYIEYLFASSLPSTTHSTMPVRMALFINEHMTLWRPLAATALISAVPMIILFLALQRHLVRGLTFGAVKQ
ncbi:MAG: carbohydrate ABC transporter permease [Candidatus Bathyarchaeia archaeon]|jgi:multiple sugar transport system permease protein